VARRPNYGQERAERNRKKAARKADKLAAKDEKAMKAKLERAGGDQTSNETSGESQS
jgi:iron only hydrogenase large subunit-like protein